MSRAGLLVDLHTVLKQAIGASVEEILLKALEVFHGSGARSRWTKPGGLWRQVEHSLRLFGTNEIEGQFGIRFRATIQTIAFHAFLSQLV